MTTFDVEVRAGGREDRSRGEIVNDSTYRPEAAAAYTVAALLIVMVVCAVMAVLTAIGVIR